MIYWASFTLKNEVWDIVERPPHELDQWPHIYEIIGKLIYNRFLDGTIENYYAYLEADSPEDAQDKLLELIREKP